jgi:uncharacterized secreted protein with C-terminal beta-propeller domain
MSFKNPKILLLAAVVFLMLACFIFLRVEQSYQKQKPVDKPAISNPTPVTTTTPALSASSTGALKQFSSLDELKAFLATNQGNSVSYGGVRTLGAGMGMGVKSVSSAEGSAPMMAPTAAPAAANDSSVSAPAAADYSHTNIQVAGVDEADIVKTDGDYIYILSNSDLFIVKALPADKTEILARINFKSRPQDIYVSGDKLAVFGNDDQIFIEPYYKMFRRQSPYSFLKVFNISDRRNPKLERDLKFEGSYFSSRLIGDYIYFVANTYNYYYDNQEPVLPRMIMGGTPVADACAAGTKCVMPPIYYFDAPYDYYNFTTVAAVNLRDSQEEPNRSMYLTSGAQNIFVSEKNLYLTYTKYLDEYQWETGVMKDYLLPSLGADDQDKIAKIEAADSFMLSVSEKTNKVRQILEHFISSKSETDQKALQDGLTAKLKLDYKTIEPEMEKTIIHKVALNGQQLVQAGSGEVRGSVLNQFSMDESGGYFRIATTRNQIWSQFTENNTQESYNNLYVLDDKMQTVGRLENLAAGERIYAARFVGDRAYLVTFRQTDPLFAIDLKDPANPKVLGQLQLAGFSNYLQPYGDHMLIGLGKDAEDNGSAGVKVKGLKVALFDVTDVSKPKILDTYVIGDSGSDSTALYDHKAVLFSQDKNLLVIPASLRQANNYGGWGDVYFNGALVFSLKDDKIRLSGKITHGTDSSRDIQQYWDGYNYYDNSVKRSLYIGDNLYTCSDRYLKINKLSDLSEVKTLELKKDKSGSGSDFEIIN